MKKVLNCISIIMFFAVTAMIGVSTVFFQHGKPFKKALEQHGNVRQAAEDYAVSNFPFKANWESLCARSAELTGRRQFRSVYHDKERDMLVDVFSEYDKSRRDKNVADINAFYKKYKGTSMYIMLAPTASGIYRSELPDSAGAIDQQKLIDDIYFDIDEAVNPLDVFSALYSARDSYIYFRTDPYWTQAGAYEAYSAAIGKMGSAPYTLANYDMDYSHVYYRGELSAKSGVRRVSEDTITACRCKYGSYVKSVKMLRDKQTYSKTSLYNSAGLNSADKYSYYLGASNFKCTRVVTTGKDLPKLLIIKSDYANCMIPFLAPHYSEITLVDPGMLEEGEKLEDLADPADYDQVLFLYDVQTFCETDEFDNLD